MTTHRNFFNRIDFDKTWSEEEWEEFFQAQEKLFREAGSAPPLSFSKTETDSSLSFRRVLRRFGMDPDNPEAAPEEFLMDRISESEIADLDEKAERFSPKREFWREGTAADLLPIYCRSRCFNLRMVLLCERYFGKMFNKTYKSRAHRRVQEASRRIQHHAAQIPRNVAAGHDLGYSRDRVRGNVARCKRALAHADACLGLVTRLSSRRLPRNEYQRLFRETARLRNDLMRWISYLRDRFS